VGDVKAQDDLIVFGTTLYNALFNGEIHKQFKVTCDAFFRFKSADACFRLVLEFEEKTAFFALLPWECICAPEFFGQHECFLVSSHVEILRASRQWELETVMPVEPPLRILIVLSTRGSLSETDANEFLDVSKELEPYRDKICTSILQDPDFERFTYAVRDSKPHIVHLVAQAERDAIAFAKSTLDRETAVDEVERETPVWINDDELGYLFRHLHRPTIVFLHPCKNTRNQSYEAFRALAYYLSASIPCVATMQYPISDRLLSRFLMEFYKSVIEGEPVYRAIHRARAILSHRPRFAEFEAASPAFYLSNWNSILAKSPIDRGWPVAAAPADPAAAPVQLVQALTEANGKA
jgi:CHAT domain